MENDEVRNEALKSIALMTSTLCFAVVGVLILAMLNSQPTTTTTALLMLTAGGLSGALGSVFTLKQEECRSTFRICRGAANAKLVSALYLASMLLALAALLVLTSY